MRVPKFWRIKVFAKIRKLEEDIADLAKFSEARLCFVYNNDSDIRGYYRNHLFDFAVEKLRESHVLFSQYTDCFLIGGDYNANYNAAVKYCARMMHILYKEPVKKKRK